MRISCISYCSRQLADVSLPPSVPPSVPPSLSVCLPRPTGDLFGGFEVEEEVELASLAADGRGALDQLP